MDLFKDEESKIRYYNVYDKTLSQLKINYETFYIETTYGNTHIIHCGKNGKKKLIMLHCMGFSSIAWLENIKGLSNEFDIYCIDSVGEPGRTISYTNKIKFNDYMEWMTQLFDKMGLEQVNLVGWSFGGFLATGYAIYQPKRIKNLVVLSPASTVSPLSLNFYFNLFPALFSGKDEKIASFLKWMLCVKENSIISDEIFLPFYEGMKSFRGWATGTKLRVFTEKEFKCIIANYYLIIGNRDPIYRKGQHKKIIKKMNKFSSNINAELINGTHGFPWQQANEINQKIIKYLK